MFSVWATNLMACCETAAGESTLPSMAIFFPLDGRKNYRRHADFFPRPLSINGSEVTSVPPVGNPRRSYHAPPDDVASGENRNYGNRACSGRECNCRLNELLSWYGIPPR
jgi:hypothetical protein